MLKVFSAAWAVATFFHVWVSTRSAEVFSSPTQLGWAHLACEAAALLVLLAPGSVRRLSLLAVVQLWSVWLEMPLIGNHWVLAGLVDVALLVVVVAQRFTFDPARVAAWFFPVARWCLLGFYAFAAFAKVNSSFIRPEVSCGSFFFAESLRSLHLGALVDTRTGVLGTAATWGTLVTELSVPVLLADRRLRHIGVVVALTFHFLIALDRAHLFSDFSSLLVALFLLFLPPAFGAWVIGFVDRRVRVVALGGLGAVALLLAFPQTTRTSELFDDGRQVAWYFYGAIVLVAVAGWLWRTRPAVVPGMLRVPRWFLWVVPAVVLFNGLTPYLELKTGWGWNMYSNLRTAGGESNHLLVRRTLPLTDGQEELVEVLESNDPGLQYYVSNDYSLAWTQFRIYLSHHPDVSVRYQRGTDVVSLERASDEPSLVAPVPLWQEKFELFRAVDQSDDDHVRCQPSFAPAR